MFGVEECFPCTSECLQFLTIFVDGIQFSVKSVKSARPAGKVVTAPNGIHLPSGWIAMEDTDGNLFFYNDEDGISQRSVPVSGPGSSESLGLPPPAPDEGECTSQFLSFTGVSCCSILFQVVEVPTKLRAFMIF